MIQTANKMVVSLINQLQGKHPLSHAALEHLWNEKNSTKLLQAASFLSWVGLRAQAGMPTLGMAALLAYLLTTNPKKVIKANPTLAPQIALYAWPRVVSQTITDHCHTSGAVLAMLAADPPEKWRGAAFTAYKMAILGFAVRVSTFAQTAPKPGKKTAQCKYCSKKFTTATEEWDTEGAANLHLFLCPFGQPTYGETLLQSQADPSKTFAEMGLYTCQVCQSPVVSKQPHESMCAGRWKNVPKTSTPTFWPYNCPECKGTVYLPGLSFNLPPGAHIEYHEATSEEKQYWEDTVVATHKRAHKYPTPSFPAPTAALKFSYEFDADEALDICPQAVLGAHKVWNTTYDACVADTEGGTVLSITADTFVKLIDLAVQKPEAYIMPVFGHYTSGIAVNPPYSRQAPTEVSPGILALMCAEYDKYRKNPISPKIKVTKATYQANRQTNKKTPKAVTPNQKKSPKKGKKGGGVIRNKQQQHKQQQWQHNRDIKGGGQWGEWRQ